MKKNPRIETIFESKAKEIPGVRAAVIASGDGLEMYSCGIGRESAERLAALAASMGSLAGHISEDRDAGTVKRTLVEMDGGFFIIARAGQRSLLAADVDPGANLGSVGYELTLLTKQLAEELDAQVRESAEREAAE